MSLRVKAIILLTVFCVILLLPFTVHAASGNIFNGLPIPIPGGGQDNQGSAAEGEYSAAMDQYAAGLPKPTVPVQVDMNYMRNHMVILKQPGHSTKECASCHTDRANFCDKCHNYVGISPKIDF
jgi:hypothetical protein